MDELQIMTLVFVMDLLGYEQDGEGLDFVGVGCGTEPRLSFTSWKAVSDFAASHAK